MSKIVLNGLTVPVIQISNRRIPKNEKLVMTLQYGLSDRKTDNPDEYVGKCKLELFTDSEKDVSDKTFFSLVEVEGVFQDKSGSASSEEKKNEIIRTLLPQANAIFGTAMSLAKVPPAFIPEYIYAELDD